MILAHDMDSKIHPTTYRDFSRPFPSRLVISPCKFSHIIFYNLFNNAFSETAPVQLPYPISFRSLLILFLSLLRREPRWHVINSSFSLAAYGLFPIFLYHLISSSIYSLSRCLLFSSFFTRYFCYDQTPEKIPFNSVLMSIMEYKLL